MDLKVDEMTGEERVKLWLPQARMLAAKAQSGDEVMRFLVGKGVPEVLAGETAARLWTESQQAKVWWKDPKRWIGWSLLVFGVLMTCFSFLVGGGVLAAIAACGLSGLGAAVLWGGFLERT
ncbi:hypothetical protein HAHE_28640 [Haloferula helveola]|uniref:Uncharacterized protein n=1 Tax=Haloferula helveola TaxID=490095 RepID=A0ABN6H5P9_9BACT|nr:hypothetical protein HAHE_28640 [Haloferula helveola]